MLSSAEADLARRDLDVPGLATVLDPDAFLAVLRSAVPASDVCRAEIGHVKYTPRAFCRAAYRVEAGGAELDLGVRACRREALDGILERAGPATQRIVLRDLAVVVTIFPNDPRLPQLGILNDPMQRRRVLRELLPDRPDLWEGEVRRLRYRPERRYAAEVRGHDGSRVLLKAMTPRSYQRARRCATAFRSGPQLRVARLLGSSDRLHLLGFEWLPGTMLSERFVAREPDAQAFAGTGAALAALHAQPADGLEGWARDDEIDHLLTLSREIAFIYPRFATRAAVLTRRLSEWLARVPPATLPLHGDFNGGQVLVDGTSVGIVDLDTACCGDPADDLGNLLAQMETQALLGTMTPGHLDRTRDALLTAYGSTGDAALLGRVGAYTALGLVRRSRYAFRDRKLDWRQVVDASLSRAEAILDSGA